MGLSSCSEQFNPNDSALHHRNDSGFEISNTLDLSGISSASSGKSTDPHISSCNNHKDIDKTQKGDNELIEIKKLLQFSPSEMSTNSVPVSNFSNFENESSLDAGLLIIAPHKRNSLFKSTETGLEILREKKKSKLIKI